jgi:hypothetical protein
MTTTITELVKTALSGLSPAVPYAVAPYKSATGTLPDLYLAYSLIDGAGAQHADNVETLRTYQVQVSIYSIDGLAVLPNVDGVMTAAGFTRGREHQLPQDPDSGHYGLAKDYYFLQ